MHGFLNIDKPAGITSHDVVAQVRRALRQKRVGHAGTLDPAATGVLVVAIGQATRLIEYVQDATRKRYTALVRLGVTTTTDDAEGETLGTASVPALDRAALEAALEPFRGEIMQVPPMYSALHHEGQRLYELARAGQVVDIPARPVHIYGLNVVRMEFPDVTLDIECAKGTYIRSLARDLGVALGCGAHLAGLRRTAVGEFQLDTATLLTDLVQAAEQRTDAGFDLLLPPLVAVRDWPIAALDAEQLGYVRNGRAIQLAQAGERARVHTPDGTLLALLNREQGNLWQPIKVFDWK